MKKLENSGCLRMSCNVCVSDYNKSNRKLISCDHCGYDACRKCCETYIIQTKEDAHCMNCKKEWTRKMLVEKFTNIFVNVDYKKMRENILYDQEKALLPATQSIVEKTKQKLVIKDRIKEINAQIKALKQELGVLYRTHYSVEFEQEKKQFIKKCPDQECRGSLTAKCIRDDGR
jgi:hypothetical protein